MSPSKIVPCLTQCLKFEEAVLLEEFRQLAQISKFAIKPRLDDDFIYRFLRSQKYDVGKAVKKLQTYYENAHKNLDFIKNVRPSQFTEALRSGVVMSLKGRCHGRRVAVARPRVWDTKAISLKDLQLTALYLSEYASFETQVQDNGGIIVVDVDGVSMAHIMKLSLSEIKRIHSTVQGGTAIKIKEVHLVNPYYLMWPLFRLIMTLLKTKLRNRIHIHYSLTDFHQYIDRKILPRSLGGDLDDTEAFDVNLVELVLKEDYPFEDFCIPDGVPERIFGYTCRN